MSPRVTTGDAGDSCNAPKVTDLNRWEHVGHQRRSNPTPTVPRTQPRAAPNTVKSPQSPERCHHTSGVRHWSATLISNAPCTQRSTHSRYPLGVPAAEVAVEKIDARHEQDGETKSAAPVPSHGSLSLLVVQELFGGRRR